MTNPERIPRWFLPVSGDLKEGDLVILDATSADGAGASKPPTSPVRGGRMF